jgi:hypothetical protein
VSVQRVALIFDDTARPETTGVYCLRALESLVAVEYFRPTDLGRVSRAGFDLYLNIDDGLRYALPADLRPAAWWAIDTHMDFDWCLTRSHDFDFVFAAQRDGAARLRDGGISTTWLPLACDPAVHRKHDVEKSIDVCFVGNVIPGTRADLLRLLQGRFCNTFVGQCYFDDMARSYSASRVVFNRSVRNDVNMRVFEAAGGQVGQEVVGPFLGDQDADDAWERAFGLEVQPGEALQPIPRIALTSGGGIAHLHFLFS